MIGGLLSRAWGYVAAAAAAVAVIGAAFLRGQRAGRDAVAAEAARRGEEARQRGEAAAREAQRKGAADRLRDGRF
jgi:hypothetical protein